MRSLVDFGPPCGGVVLAPSDLDNRAERRARNPGSWAFRRERPTDPADLTNYSTSNSRDDASEKLPSRHSRPRQVRAR